MVSMARLHEEFARLKQEAWLRAATAGQPAVTSEDGGGTMDLEARSPVVAIATKSLSQAQTARLVAAECHRHKLDHMVLTTHCTILWRTLAAEGFWDADKTWFWDADRKWRELSGPITETINKRLAIERQMIDLGGEKCRALAEASLSVLGTVTIGERRFITQVVEPQDFKDGAVLIEEGDPRDALFIIVEGQVSFRRHHRYEVGPARAALGAPHSALALGTPAPRCSARQGSLCAAGREAPSRAPARAPGASRL